MSHDLLADINAFLGETGMGPSYFGKMSCGNSELVKRLRQGRSVELITADSIREFMSQRRALKTQSLETEAI